MKTKLLFVPLVGLLGLAAGYLCPAQACGLPQLPLDILAGQATSENQAVSAAAITQLRARGPQGLDALLNANAALLARHESQANPGAGADWRRLKNALDAVGGQCDCYASRLYWYTDLQSAKAAAKISGKPILSLRLLGKLNEEFSCANSRFFRTTLYPNAAVSKYLREHFILHWQSVRPVPKITIDFGDGRRIERTITGNSAHYVLDSDGQLIDALPGLYGPKAFVQELKNDEEIALACAGVSVDQKRQRLAQYHSQRRQAAVRAWNADLARLGERPAPLPVLAVTDARDTAPTAKMAGQLAFSKRAIEAPMLKSTQPPGEASPPGRASITDELWARLVALHAVESQLDESAIELVASKLPTALEASQVATSKRLVESPVLQTLRNLQRTIAEDTLRNEYLLHAQVHQWFVENNVPANLDKFNAKVYAELFLTPESDPWLGLAPANVFTGLPGAGLIQISKVSGGGSSDSAAN